MPRLRTSQRHTTHRRTTVPLTTPRNNSALSKRSIELSQRISSRATSSQHPPSSPGPAQRPPSSSPAPVQLAPSQPAPHRLSTLRHLVTFRFLYTLISLILIVTGSIIVIRFAQGDRLTNQGTLKTTGLFVANSFPTGAEVLINDRLVTATDNTINLEPGEYKVEIRKEGYSPWQKNLRIQQSLVTQTNAQLFRQVPGLTPLTFFGVSNVTPSPDGQRLVFYTSSASSPAKNGLYVLELNSALLSSFREPSQISDDMPSASNLSTAQIVWSPDSTQILVQTATKEMMLDVTKKQSVASLPDVSLTKQQVLSEWREEMLKKEAQYLEKFPVEVVHILQNDANNVYLSPDKKRVFYTATAPAVLPENLTPGLPAANNQPEERMLRPGVFYVYDREEDKNFALGLAGELPLPEKVGTRGETGDVSGSNAGNTSTSAIVQPVKTLLSAQLASPAPDLSLSASSAPLLGSTSLPTASPFLASPSLATLLATSPLPTSARARPMITPSPTPSILLSPTSSPFSLTTAQDFPIYYSPFYTNGIQWMPDSKHFLYMQQDKILIREYDNTNQTILYSGPFANRFVYPWPDGSKLVILASFSANSPLNLYVVEIK